MRATAFLCALIAISLAPARAQNLPPQPVTAAQKRAAQTTVRAFLSGIERRNRADAEKWCAPTPEAQSSLNAETQLSKDQRDLRFFNFRWSRWNWHQSQLGFPVLGARLELSRKWRDARGKTIEIEPVYILELRPHPQSEGARFRLARRIWRADTFEIALARNDNSLERSAIWREEQVGHPLHLSQLSPQHEADLLGLATRYARAVVARDEKSALLLAASPNREDLRAYFRSHAKYGAHRLRSVRLVFPRARKWKGQKRIVARAVVAWHQKIDGASVAATQNLLLEAIQTPQGLRLADQFSYRDHDTALSVGSDAMRGAIYRDDFESKLATFPRPVPAATQKIIESDVSAMLRAHLHQNEARVRAFWLPETEATDLTGTLRGMRSDAKTHMESVEVSRFGRWSREQGENGPEIRVRAWVRWNWKANGQPDWNERWWIFTLQPRAERWKIATRWRRAESFSQAFRAVESAESRALIARDEHHGQVRRAASAGETTLARAFFEKLLGALRQNRRDDLKTLCFPNSPAFDTLDDNLTSTEVRPVMATLGALQPVRVVWIEREGKSWLEARGEATMTVGNSTDPYLFILQIERDGENWRARRAFWRDADLIAALGANGIANAAFLLSYERDRWNVGFLRELVAVASRESLKNEGRDRAFHLAEATLQLAAFLGDPDLLGDAYGRRGGLLESNFKGEKMGESAGVTDDYRQSLLNFRAAGNRPFIGFGLHRLGQQASNVAQYDLAEKFELAALGHARNIGDTVTQTLVLQALGDIYDALSQDARAADFYERARALAAREGFASYEIDALVNLGAWQFNRGQIGRGWRILETARQKARQNEFLDQETSILRALSQAAIITGQWNEAIARLEQARVLARKLGDVSLEFTVIKNLRAAHGQRFLEAGAPVVGSNRTSMPSRDLEAVGVLTADLWEMQDKLPVSLSNESLVASAYLSETGFNLDVAALRPAERRGVLLAGEEDTLDRMESYARKNKQFGRLAGIQVLRGQLRRLQGRTAEGIAQLAAARVFYETGSDNLGALATLRREEGDNWRDQKEWQRAADAYRASIAQTEKQRAGAGDARLQTGLLAGNVAAYQRLAECLLRLGAPPEQVLGAVEAARARALVELMQRGGAGSGLASLAHLAPEQKKRRASLESAVTKWQKQLDFFATSRDLLVPNPKTADETRPEAETAAQTRALLRAAADLGASEGFTNVEIASREETKAKLQAARLELDAFDRTLNSENGARAGAAPEDVLPAALLERLFAAHPQRRIAMFQVGDDATLLILLRKEDGKVKTRVFEIKVARAALRAQVEAARRSFARPSSIGDDFSELHTLLLGQIQNQLEGASDLMIVPDDSLAGLPFGALNDENGAFLIQKCAISYAPGLAALGEMEKRAAVLQAEKSRTRAPFLGISRSDFAEIGLKTLPGTRAEVAAIAPLFGNLAIVAQNERATKAFARGNLPGARLIHLATHGLLNESAPLYSSVALAPDADDPDGRLYARDLMQMDLSAHLVVLSACETALGQSVRGEGILGLTWSIFVAGAPTTLVTQWSVDDAATSALMQKFYAEIQAAKSPAQALRDAQLSLLKSKTMKHPAYWAPFIAVGAAN